MDPQLTQKQIKKIIMTELPKIIQSDEEVHRHVLAITSDRYADREKTDDRIDRILDELKRDREKSDARWRASEKKWEENQKQWDKNQKVINEMLASIKQTDQKFDSTIGALGARWGIHSEVSFRRGLRSILERSFEVKVERYHDFDHEGMVFGKPDQIEMDVIIHNETLILCEIKSSISKSQMYAFWRKKEFYENKHQRKADRILVISPMVDESAEVVADNLGIEVFSYADKVDL
ncbi:MAG: DUF3782 domain-containing protein [Desulfobacterales bacterium]|nr:DUF3782 domain-containing protein [Desulfobacterales bacterium]